MQHSNSEPHDLGEKGSRHDRDMTRKSSRLVLWAQEGVNVTYAKMMYFCVLLAIGFTWNINAVVQGPTRSSGNETREYAVEPTEPSSFEGSDEGTEGSDETSDTEAKESWHQFFVSIVVVVGIALIMPQLSKLRIAPRRRHRPIPYHMSIVIWFLGILTVLSECWMAIR